jgi:hypothetical protein
MIKYVVENGNLKVEFLTQNEADLFVNANGGTISQITENLVTASNEEIERELATKKREFGIYLVAEFTDSIAARNKILGKTTQQVISVLTNLQSVKAVLEGGALATARSLIVSLKTSYPDYDDIFQDGINDINKFESEYGL